MAEYRYRVETDEIAGIVTQYDGPSLDAAVLALRDSVEAGAEYVSLEAMVAVPEPGGPETIQMRGGVL